MKLFQAYMPPVVFAALFRDTPSLADRPFETVRGDVERLLLEAEAQCADIPAEGRREALFAVCAFVDEALLTSSWQSRGRWARETLQRTRFGTVNAGIEFYDYVRALLGAESGPAAFAGAAPDFAAGETGGAAGIPASSAAVDLTLMLKEPARGAGAADIGSAGRGTDARTKPSGLPLGTSLDLAGHAGGRAGSAAAARGRKDGQSGKGCQDSWQEDALGLYGACMSMGFKGRYYDASEREALFTLALSSLEKAAGSRVYPGQRQFTPESYYMPERDVVRRGTPWAVRLPLLLVPAAVTLLIYAAYDHVFSTYVNHWLAAIENGLL
ncbi:MAG: DotU family type IV/VI secretion system protein [Desulfovibrionaceae bacterium]|nr:DotU family type IV/VI secretion system protein [Desulfovibrionaceae bacterium]